jgi:hypothetical protein
MACHGAAIAQGAEVFCRVEAEGGGIAEAADRTAAITGAMRLGGVFENPLAVSLRHRIDRVHVGGVTV